MRDLPTPLENPGQLIPEPQIERYVPSRQEALSAYEINIRFLSRGCIVRVGCKEVPFEDTDVAFAEIKNYFMRPFETQEKWREILK